MVDKGSKRGKRRYICDCRLRSKGVQGVGTIYAKEKWRCSEAFSILMSRMSLGLEDVGHRIGALT